MVKKLREKLLNLNSSLNIIRGNKSRTVRGGEVVCFGERRN